MELYRDSSNNQGQARNFEIVRRELLCTSPLTHSGVSNWCCADLAPHTPRTLYSLQHSLKVRDKVSKYAEEHNILDQIFFWRASFFLCDVISVSTSNDSCAKKLKYSWTDLLVGQMEHVILFGALTHQRSKCLQLFESLDVRSPFITG